MGGSGQDPGALRAVGARTQVPCGVLKARPRESCSRVAQPEDCLMYSCFGEGQDSWTFCLWRSLRNGILRGWAAQLSDLGPPPSRLLPPGTLGWHRPGSETPSGVAHSGDPRTPWAAAPPLR